MCHENEEMPWYLELDFELPWNAPQAFTAREVLVSTLTRKIDPHNFIFWQFKTSDERTVLVSVGRRRWRTAPWLCSHLWGLPGWSSLTCSPSRYKNPLGLSYLLSVPGCSPAESVIAAPVDSLSRWLASWGIDLVRQAHPQPPSSCPEDAGHLEQSPYFPDVYSCRFAERCGKWSLKLPDMSLYWAVLGVNEVYRRKSTLVQTY